ncbi:MAG: TetR/AcrR family transcriptional regulator [Acidobacteria bacterium]|nr:TetR/AcrR family transcriptional regulator [Acidobacteriota bacterium]MBK9529716.1 TetR/AcrR family transcriptional regulator [Acidobacteriota bacterium]MBP7475835.1 TetR/AcrR family transcriptional regulator [Pyrinomonadaceae bacterium]MBP9108417.1 TetR/AcrR family transcriptional regulator [Pyrinomonadaceae bacterium]
MPKLSAAAIQGRKDIIEDAARELFIKQGFHATSMRDICKRAEVSLGNLYNYYETKDSIFESIIDKYQTVIDEDLRSIFAEIDEPMEPANLRKLGESVGRLVNEHSDFWLLMYIDVLEFQNRHFRKMFDGITDRFRKVFGEKFKEAEKRGDLRMGVDAAPVFTAVYMQFFNYFLVEKLFGGNQHLGLTDDQALNCLTKVFAYGTLSEDGLARFKKTANKSLSG